MIHFEEKEEEEEEKEEEEEEDKENDVYPLYAYIVTNDRFDCTDPDG